MNQATAQDSLRIYLADDDATVALGRNLGEVMGTTPACVYLLGDLGAGKTTLCRGVLQSRGYKGAVKSPTYTLVEPYELDSQPVYHFDLYRLADAAELEFLGLDTYFSGHALCLVEWPDRGGDFLPPADLVITLAYVEARPPQSSAQPSEAFAREATIEACSAVGQSVLQVLQGQF